MSLGTLTGFAIPALNFPGGDHTYVASSNGHAWGCHGRAMGGVAICTGSGNVDQADCLATPQHTAGIRYGISGVCHQAANRILWPSRMTVAMARGARGSFFTWGVYGRDSSTLKTYSPAHFPWPELAVCTAGHSHP
jgi:hypothetical protein